MPGGDKDADADNHGASGAPHVQIHTHVYTGMNRHRADAPVQKNALDPVYSQNTVPKP